MKKGRRKPLSRTARSSRSAYYWRTRYEQLQSDFDELLAVNRNLISLFAELEGRTVVAHHHMFHNVGDAPARRPFGNTPKILPYLVPGGIR